MKKIWDFFISNYDEDDGAEENPDDQPVQQYIFKLDASSVPSKVPDVRQLIIRQQSTNDHVENNPWTKENLVLRAEQRKDSAMWEDNLIPVFDDISSKSKYTLKSDRALNEIMEEKTKGKQLSLSDDKIIVDHAKSNTSLERKSKKCLPLDAIEIKTSDFTDTDITREKDNNEKNVEVIKSSDTSEIPASGEENHLIIGKIDKSYLSNEQNDDKKKLTSKCHEQSTTLSLTNSETNLNLTADDEKDGTKIQSDLNRLSNYSSSIMKKSSSKKWSLLSYFHTYHDESNNLSDLGSITRKQDVMGIEKSELLQEDISSENIEVENQNGGESSSLINNIDCTDPHYETNIDVIKDAHDLQKKGDLLPESNDVRVEFSKETDISHEHGEIVNECHEDKSRDIITAQNNSTHCQLNLGPNDSEEEEDALSESNPFGFEVKDEAEVHNGDQVIASEEDPFGFESEKKEQEALLESFRIQNVDTAENKNSSKRSQTFHNTKAAHFDEPHPSQPLFDILNRNIDSFDLFQMHSNDWGITAEDVKLCFAALVLVLSPPKSVPYADEYNHNLDDEIQRSFFLQSPAPLRRQKWFFQRKDEVLDNTDENWAEDLTKEENEEESGAIENKKDNYHCTYVPLIVVYSLWAEVLKCRTMQLTNRDGESHMKNSLFTFIVESLSRLELVDLDPTSPPKFGANRGREDTGVIETSERVTLQGKKCDSKMIGVHHAINQQYGEYLAISQFNAVIQERKGKWFSAVASVYLEDLKNIDEYKITMVPHIMIKAGKYEDAKSLLTDKNYVRKRMEFLGILVGTTAQVTDVDELLASFVHNRQSDRVHKSQETIETAYDLVKRFIERSFKCSSPKGDSESDDLEDISICTESGKAFHLMAVSMGENGISDKEHEYFATALRLKQLGVKNENQLTISISDTLHCMGLMYDNSGNFADAITSYDQALQIRRALLGNDNLKVAETCHNKGAILSENSQLEDALILLTEALQIRIRHLGDDHESVADTQQWMGNVMRELGDSHEAIDYFKNALRIKKLRFGDDDEDVASVLYNMAIVLDDLSDYDLSIKYYTEALRIRELHHGGNSLLVADTLQSIGISYSASGDNGGALASFVDSVAVRESLLKADMVAVDLDSECHISDPQPVSDDVNMQCKKLIECYEEVVPLTNIVNNNSINVISLLERMGEIYSKVQDWDKALESLQGALDLKIDNNLGSNYDSQSVGLLQKVGQVYILNTEYSKALSYLNEALIQRKQLLTNKLHSQNSHDYTEKEENSERGANIVLNKEQSIKSFAMNHYLVGVCFNKLNQHQQALTSFTECLILLKKADKRDIIIGHTLHWLGRQHHGLKEYNKAISRYVSTLQIYRIHSSNINHQVIVETLHSLGNSYFKNEQLQMALKCYKEEIKLSEAARSLCNSSNVAEAFYCAGNIYGRMKCYDKAILSFEKSLTEMQLEDGNENIRFAKTLDKLGTMHTYQKNNNKAREILNQSWMMFRKVLGEDDLQNAAVAFKLGQLLDEVHDFEQAIDYYDDCLRVREMQLGPHHEDVASTLFCMGKNAYARLKFDDAIDCNERALFIRRRALGVDNTLVASTLHELGRAYWFKGEYDKAMVCYRESLRIWKAAGSLDEAGNVSLDIAKSHESSGNYEQAVKSYMECIQLFASETHASIPLIHHSIGTLLEKMEKWSEAVTQLETCYEMLGLGCDNRSLKVSCMHSLCRSKVMVAQSVTNGDIQIRNGSCLAISDEYMETLATSSSKDGNALREEEQSTYAEALSSYAELQKMLEVDDHHNNQLADTYFEVGSIYLVTKKYTKAHENYEKSLTIKRTYTQLEEKSDDSSTGKILIAIALVNEKLADLSSASVHAIEALRIFRLKRKDLDTATSLLLLARINESSCNTKAAIECFEECLKLHRQMARDSDLSIASIFQSFACFLIRTGDDDRALELLNSAVRIRKSELGIDSIITARTVHMIGEVLTRKCQFDKGRKYILQAVQVRINEYGRDHEDIAHSQHLLGVINVESGQYEAAIPFLQDALRIKKLNATGGNLTIACTLHYLGQVYWKIANYGEAIHHLIQASTIRKQELGPESTEYAHSLECLGCANYCNNNCDEALRCLVDSLRIYELDENVLTSTDTKKAVLTHARIKEWIGKTLFQLEKYEKALAMFLHCKPIYEENFGMHDEAVGNMNFYIGKIQVKMQNYDAAMKSFKESLSIRKKGGSQKSAVVEVLLQVGDIFLSQNNEPIKALDCFDECVRICKKIRDDEHIASALCFVGRANLEAGYYDKAMASFKEARSKYSVKYGNECVEVGKTLTLIARVFEAMSTFTDALDCYKSSLCIFRKHMDEDDIAFAPIFYHVGTIYFKEEKFIEAEDNLNLCIKICRKRLNANHTDIADALVILADVKVKKGESSMAIPFYKEACEIYIHQKQDMNIAKCLESMACTHFNINELDDALLLYSKAWKIRSAHQADDTIEGAAILFGLGVVHHEKSQHEEAFNFLRRCLNLYMVKKGKGTFDVGRTCEQLGHVLVSMERYEDAFKVYDNARVIYQKLLGKNHLHCANISNCLGDTLFQLKKYDDALLHFEASLEIFIKKIGKNSREVANTFISIAKIHDNQVDMEKAMKYMSGALKIQTALHGKDNLDVADTLLKIAQTLEDWGDTDEAMGYFRGALRIYQLKSGKSDLQAASVLNQIGSIHYEREEYEDAVEAYKKAMLIYKKKLGENSSEVGHILQDIGAVYDSMSEHENALIHYSEALDILKESLGSSSLAVALALNSIGINLARRKEFSKAIEFCSDALRIRKAQLSENHVDVADALYNIGKILDECGNKDERAVKFYSEALVIYRSNNPDNEDVANCARDIGVLHIKKNQINEAIPLLLNALRIYRLKGSDTLDVASILFHLGRIYGKQTNYEKSLGCFKESLRIRMKELDHDNPDVLKTRKIIDNIRRKIAR